MKLAPNETALGHPCAPLLPACHLAGHVRLAWEACETARRRMKFAPNLGMAIAWMS